MIVQAMDGPDSKTWRSLAAAETPTVWLHTNRLRQGDADKLAQSGCTDLAIQLDPKGVHTSHAGSPLARTLHELRQVLNLGGIAQPQSRLRTWLALKSDAPKVDLEALIQWARAHGVAHIRLISGERL